MFLRGPVAFGAPEQFPFLAEVTGEKVNLRSGENTNFESILRLTKGDTVVAVAKKYSWYKVQLPAAVSVYIRSDYIERVDNSVGKITGQNVNIRVHPSAESTSLGQFKKDELVTVLEVKEGWSRVKAVEGLYGWIHEDYLKMKSRTVSSWESLGLARLKPKPQEPPPAFAEEQVPSARVQVTGRISGMVLADGQKWYTLTIQGETAYFLQDDGMLGGFTDAVVNLEAVALIDAQKKFTHPALVVNRLTMVL